LRIAHLSAEVHPFAVTGGLGGVVGSLPSALQAAGHECAVFAPFYSRRIEGAELLEGTIRTTMGEEFNLARAGLPGGVPVYFVAREELFGRPGFYGPTDYEAYPDNAGRFAFFCRACLAASEALGGFDILHCHDWHSGLVPAMCRASGGPATVFTIHNLAYQGRFPADQYAVTGLPASMLDMHGLEYYGDFSFIKAGIVYSDFITTVSPTYAAEILDPSRGEGMDGVLATRADRLTGILNGIDVDLWGPEDDPMIPAWFTASALANRRRCRAALLETTGLDAPSGVPVVAVVSRLTWQKGIDLVQPALLDLVSTGAACAVVLGAGDAWMEESLAGLAGAHPGRVFFKRGWDEALSHMVYSGSDIFLMPSRFEPCGLSQMIAMRYGCLPVVRRTGGLADTVTDNSEGGPGFVFEEESATALSGCLSRAATLFGDRRRWMAAVRRAMSRDDSWESRVPAYEEVYARAAAR
jgi:starch synthase